MSLQISAFCAVMSGLLISCGIHAHQSEQGFDASAIHDAAKEAADAASTGDAAVGLVAAELLALALPAVTHAPPDPTNRVADDQAAANLGRRLFFDPSFSGRLLDGDNDGSSHALGRKGETGKVACAGCHLPESNFSDTRSIRRQISLAAGWGKRRTPSLLDVAQSKLLMWDGRRDTFYGQIFGVIESPVEMNSSRLFVAQQVFARHKQAYEAIFGALPPLDDATRFPALSAERTGCSMLAQDLRSCGGEWHGVPGDQAEYDGMSPADQDAVTRIVVNIGKALGSYERLLTCGESRFDLWARGTDPGALTLEEQRGAALFVGKGKCVGCHSGPYFSDEKFHNVGLKPEVVATVFVSIDDPGAAGGLAAAQEDPLNSKGVYSDGDDGRLRLESSSSLEGAFRTPKLRCAANRPSFMHTGQIGSLAEVVAFFDRGGDPVGFLGHSEISPLGLTPQERADLVAFILALEGPGADPQLTMP